MNIVDVNNNIILNEETCVSDLIGNNLNDNHTAFLGKVGSHQKLDLFLICYNCVFLASDPTTSWSFNVSINVYKWVDIKITCL